MEFGAAYTRSMLRIFCRPTTLLALALLSGTAWTAPALDSLDACRSALGAPPRTVGADPLPPLLRLLSWNTMKYARQEAAPMLRRLGANADLVLLQEGLSEADRDSTQYYRWFADGYRSERGQSGVELRSRIPADVVCTLRFTEPWLRTPKAVLITRHAFADTSLLIANLHGVNFAIGVRAYGEQFSAIAGLLAAHQGPAIVAGDFNNWSGRREAIIDALARDAGLQRARFTPDWRSRHLGSPVDGLLQRGFEIVSATAVPTRASDHHPLIVLLRRASQVPPASEDSPAAGVE